MHRFLIATSNQKIMTCMDLSMSTMHEFEFVLAVFARFLNQSIRKVHGYHLLMAFKDDSLIEQAN